MRLTRANTKAIKHACLKFHYAKAVPSVQYGFNVYNDKDEWCGVICYGGGANPNMGRQYGCRQGEILELVRVALNGKQETTSKAVALSLKVLHKVDPLVKVIISYADLDQDHAGTIYQATNWIYLGKMNEGSKGAYIINGKKTHPKTVYSAIGTNKLSVVREKLDPNATEFITKGKHKYIYIYNKDMRKEWQKKSLPYPKKKTQPE